MNDYLHRLRTLAKTNREPIRAEIPKRTGDEKVAVLRFYDPVDSWGGDFGMSAKELASALDDMPDSVEEIRLHVNSPGGEVFEGIAVLNALRAHDARVVAVVDGLAASAASFIAAGCDEVVMARNSEMMIHDAWGLCVGNAQDMRDLAEDLDRLSDNIASVYAEKAGGTVADWRAAMSRETWYSAEEAVKAGLADRVDTKAGEAKNTYDLSIFTYAGREQAPAPATLATLNPGERVLTADEVRAAYGVPPVANQTEPTPEATEPDDSPDAAAEERELQAQRVRVWELTA